MYEIPEELKDLYKHWGKHADVQEAISKTKECLDTNLLKEIEVFASERMRIWNKKYHNNPPPYTADNILRDYRFCNVYRELDKQTIEIHTLLRPLLEDFDTWLLNLFFCRFVCNTDTIKKVGLLSYDEEKNKKVYKKLLGLERPKYGSAYVFPISIIQKSEYQTREDFFCLYLPQVMARVSKEIESFNNTSVADGAEKIITVLGFSFRFHTTEVLIDVTYQYPKYINLFDKFPIGLGSEPTMRTLSGKDPQETCLVLTRHHMKDFPYLTYNGKPILLSAENWEGIGCEFRKYTNLSQGKGRRRIYRQKP